MQHPNNTNNNPHHQRSRRGGPQHPNANHHPNRGSLRGGHRNNNINNPINNNHHPNPQNYMDGGDPQYYQPPPPPPMLQPQQKPPPPQQGSSRPLITLTIDPSQFMPNLPQLQPQQHPQPHGQQQQSYGNYAIPNERFDTGYSDNNHHQTYSPQSRSFQDDRPPPYSPSPAPPTQYSSRPNHHHDSRNTNFRGAHSSRPPSPPPPYHGLLPTPQFPGGMPCNDFPQDRHSQSRRGGQGTTHNPPSSSNFSDSNQQHVRGRGRGRGSGSGSRGRGNFRGNAAARNMAGSMSDLSDKMPLGCEASKYTKKNKNYRSKDNSNDNDDGGEEDDYDGSASVQSMPIRGRNPSRGGRGGNGRGSNRGVGRGGRGGKTSSTSQDIRQDASDTLRMKVSHHQEEDKYNCEDNKSVTSSCSSSKSGLRHKQGNEKNRQHYKKESGDSKTDYAKTKSVGNTNEFESKTSSQGNNEYNKKGKPDMKSKKPGEIELTQDPQTKTQKPSSEDEKKQTRRGRGRGKTTKKAGDDDFERVAKRLNVFLKMKKSFECGGDLKKAVLEAFEFPNNGKFRVNFHTNPLLEENSSSIKFALLTNNVWMANKCVKNMTGKLRGKLGTYIHSVCHLDKSHSDSNSVKEVVKDEVLQNVKKDGQEKKVDDDKTKTVDVKDEPEEGKVPDMCPVSFHLSMEKPFAQVDGYIDFMTTILNDFSSIEDFNIKQDSVVLSKTSSECVIDLNSKADARRLKKTIFKFQKESKLEMSYTVTKIEQETEIDEDKMKVWNSRILKVLEKMETKKSDVASQHDEKMTVLRNKMKVLEQAEGENQAEMDAVGDKLTEALKQKLEFGPKCKAISKRIKEIKPSKTKEQELRKMQETFGVECQRLANALPIYARREDIISHVKSNQVSIILGETGSGKSTQIAQYLHEAGIVSEGLIVCTQPRKVAAVQLADRVAQELGGATGNVVGYKTGNKRKMSDNTKIVFMTDHSLLNECLEDRDFQKYSCIIVDEAHERSIYTDILLGIIKVSLERRRDLRVVITSATIDPQVFINYFQCPKEIRVSGRTYPVKVFYMESSDDFENYENKAVAKAAEIHRNEAEGDILVFLTSPVEIQRCCEEFCKIFKDRNDFKCLPLHGQLLPEEQRKVFARLDDGVRKVVFATNCAETSITIDGIKYVIDTGVSKEMRYDAKKNLNLLGVHMISQSSADQRKGRAGRTASGKCYRLFSEEGYTAMRTINEPEILRVHLGQAILKLAELGVNIREYDFVEAPSDLALQAAIETLEFLGAIKDEKISELGRYISKLPFDPKLGYIVYKSDRDGLLYDAIVLASVVSNGSGIFYRGLTETEAQISARSKAQFGLESGDLFTWLTVYKIWEGKPTSKERRQWCQSNCINYKSMNYTKTCIDEVITALKHELKVDVIKQFSEDPSSVTVLSKCMLRAYGLSLCHFTGHSRAGYFSLFSERQVHFHPSSTLAAQNLQPEWVVFVELVKTSREFIKGILVVDEEWIQEAVDEGHFNVNIAKAKAETLTVVHKEELGGSVFRAVVGPRFSNLQSLEELCETSGMKHPILEADREMGTISIYSSSPEAHQNVVNHLNKVKSEAVIKLEKEESECKIFNKDSSDSPNIRAILGQGACVRQILMPHQSTEVLLRRVGDATEEDILMKFCEFGNVLEVISFKSNEPWGFLRYRSVEEALIAVERTRRDETIAGCLRIDRVSENTKNMFQAKVSWLRRPVKGDGIAFIKVDPMDKIDLLGRDIVINGAFKRINLSNKGRQNNATEDVDDEPDLDLIVFKIGETTEEEIRDGIMVLTRGSVDIKRVTIPRIIVPAPSQKELDDIKTRLKTLIDPTDEEDFTIWISKPQNRSMYYTAFLYFTDPVRGFRICQRRNQRIRMGDHPVKISPSLKTTILIPKKIKDACREQMDELFTSMERDLCVNLEWKQLKEDHAITIRCENPEGIVKAKECITNELNCNVIDCNVTKACLSLFSASGQDLLKQTQKKTGCVIVSDKRTKKIHMYGKEVKQSQAMIEINKYFGENESNKEQIFKLKSLGKPPGLMKALMNKFGPLLDGLNEKYKLSSVTLDCRTHTLKCLGSQASVEELETFLSSFEKELLESNQAGKDNGHKSLPKCVVCMDNVYPKDGLYRLESCGHPYCVPCLQHQTLSCVQSNQFPLECAEESCGKKLVWKDLRFIFAKKWVKEEKVIQSSLNFLVSTQSERYKFCPTPNCPVVYEVTLDEAGFEFNCAACFASTCSSCHLAFHAGVSCKMAKSESNAKSYLEEWCAEDKNNRKICPSCKIPVEKTEGCNKMHCTTCRTVFCWICLQVCEDEQKCYAHLMKFHGSMFS